ncbi:MAG: hypothetical protein RLZZ148_2627 [Cyanobacteriota bacterium]
MVAYNDIKLIGTMALTPSTMLELGTLSPDFNLPDVVSGKTISLDTFARQQPTDKSGA